MKSITEKLRLAASVVYSSDIQAILSNIHSSLKKLEENLKSEPSHSAPAGPVNPVIEYETKSHYGGPEMIYVTSEHKAALQNLTGKKTITPINKLELEKLGFKFKKVE